MKEVKNKDEYKDIEEIDAYFKDVKKKGFPTRIFFIIILLLIVGGCIYYYMVIDSPKNIILNVLNDKFSNIKIDYNNYETINYDYSFDMNIITNNKEYIETSNILNQLAITGTSGIDFNNKKTFTTVNTFYKQKELLSFDAYYENDNYMYIKIDDLYDKVIKTKISDEEQEELNNSYQKTDMDTLEKVIKSLTNIIIDTINSIEYKKTYTKLNDEYVKKINLVIDEKIMKDFYNRLLNDKDFIENYSKLEGINESTLKDKINKEIANLEEYTETINLYVSILDNEFIMLESIIDKDKLVITKEKDEYNYKIYENSIIEYQGYVSIEKEDKECEISISIEDIEEELNIELNLDLSYEYNQEVNSLDTNDAIEYESLTENDMNKITNNLLNNKNFVDLMEDISSLLESETTQETYYQTT